MTNNRANILTVTQINEFVKMLFDGNPMFKSVLVKGEISNFVNHSSGHLYFTLKDENSQLRVVMYRSSAESLTFVPENGMKVIVGGRITEYVKGGVYQLCADMLQPDGVGMLYMAFEQLKRKLYAEGLFDESRKKQLPKDPSRIGIVTSPTGAAIHDMINIIGRRSPSTEIVLYPVQVQGDGAAAQIAGGVRYFDETQSVDLIIVGRGGGSAEDLWAFNDEALARTIAMCRLPVISAVGHEVDFTICDFVADMRAPTPSGAAELAVSDSNETKRKLDDLGDKLKLYIKRDIESLAQRLKIISSSSALTSPLRMLDEYRMRLSDTENCVCSAADRILRQKREKFSLLASGMEALNPLSVLTRGFAYVTHDGKGVSSVNSVRSSDTVEIRFSDGSLEAQIR